MTDADLIRQARDATTVLRDAAREGRVVDFRERDPLVMAIHRALDRLEAVGQERDEAKASRQVALNASDNLKGQLAALEADRDRLKRLLSACIPPAHEPQRSEYMAAMPKAKEGANDAD